jgi:hypothetical protein
MSPRRLADFARPLLLAVMAGCVAWSVAELLGMFFPFWNRLWTVAACVIAALEAGISYRLLRDRRIFFSDRWRLRAVELAFLFIVIKLGRYLGQPLDAFLAELQQWPRDLWRILEPETAVNFFLALGTLLLVNDTLADLDELHDPERAYSPISPRDSIISRFFYGGLILLLASGLARIGLLQLLDLGWPAILGLIANALLYFLLGLALLAQASYAHWSAIWQAEGAAVSSQLAGRWLRHSFVFVLLVAVIAFSLPTFYGEGLLGIVAAFISALFFGLYFVTVLLTGLLAALLNWLAPPAPPLSPETVPRPTPLPTAEPTPPSGPAPPPFTIPGLDLELLRSLVFWLVIAAMVTYVVFAYVRERPELMQAVRNARLFRALRRIMDFLRRQTGQWAEALRDLRPLERLRELFTRLPVPAPRFFRLGGATPREQVLYFYLSTLRRAAQLGFPRRPPQTPDEYDPVLETRLTEAQADVRALTEAFDRARYSNAPIEKGTARETRDRWEKVRAALQRRKSANR